MTTLSPIPVASQPVVSKTVEAPAPAGPPATPARPLGTVRYLALRAALAPIDGMLSFVDARYRLFLWIVSATPPAVLAKLGYWRARRAYGHAVRRVPAYRTFLTTAEVPRDAGALALPYIDKSSYVRSFPIPQRCLDGVLPNRHVAIDESSGSSGVPHNWVRSVEERAVSHRFISHFARYGFGDEPMITINAFSMGAWATGINMGIALQGNSVVKNTGPEVDNILRTMELFGTSRPYLICGYPPFVKHLTDVAAERGFPLGDYRLRALLGGEGMSEGLRDYLLQTFERVYSGYGATDLEIGMAGETPLSVALRRIARANPAARSALFGDDPRLPMVFQYNPLSHHIHVTDDRELVFTINRLNVLSPRLAYNIHDEGGVATYDQIRARLASVGVDLESLFEPDAARPLRLPFVWVYGRKDSTVSVMGANIYPEDVEAALYASPELAARTNSFCLGLDEAADGTVRPSFSFEVRDLNAGEEAGPELVREYTHRITEGVAELNSDFRTAMVEHADSVRPAVRLYAPGTGPFAGDAHKIKQVRLASVAPPAAA